MPIVFRRLLIIGVVLSAFAEAQRLEAVIPVDSIAVPLSPRCLELDSLGRRLFVGGQSPEGVVSIVDCISKERVGSLHAGGSVTAMCYNWRESKLYCARVDSAISVLDTRTGQLLAVIDLPAAPSAFAYNSTNNSVVCISTAAHIAVVVDGATNQVRSQIALPLEPRKVGYSRVVDKVYVLTATYSPGAEMSEVHLVVIDGASCQVRANHSFRGTNASCVALAVCDTLAKTFLVYEDWFGRVAVVDGVSDSVVASVGTNVLAPRSMVFNLIDDKVYVCGDERMAVLCARGDSLLRHVYLGMVAVYLLSFNAGEDKLYAGSGLAPVYVVDGHTDSLSVIIPVTGHHDWICDPVGDVLYSAAVGDEVLMIDGAGDSVIGTIAHTGVEPISALYSGSLDRTYCAISTTGEVVVVDGQQLRQRGLLYSGAKPKSLVRSPVNRAVYCANSGDSTVAIIDCGPDTVKRWIRVGREPVYLLSDTVRQRVYCLNRASGSLSMIDAVAESVVATVRVGGFPSYLCADDSSRRLFCASSGRGTVTAIDLDTDSAVWTTYTGSQPVSLVYDGPRNRVYCANRYSGTVSSIDAGSGTVLRSTTVGTGPHVLEIHPDDRKLYCGTGAGVWVINLDSAAVSAVLDSGSPFVSLHHVQTADHLYAGTGDEVRVYDCRSDSLVARVRTGQLPVAYCEDRGRQRLYVVNQMSSTIAVIRDSTVSATGDMVASPMRPRMPTFARHTYLARADECSLFDCAGRQVMTLRVGRNSLQGLRAGIYYVTGRRGVLVRRLTVLPD